jgi:hypothetical protein
VVVCEYVTFWVEDEARSEAGNLPFETGWKFTEPLFEELLKIRIEEGSLPVS